jgi:D-aminoacyl-tRNA deacylase
MYEKFLIIASQKDLAGMNIAKQLVQFGEYDIYYVDRDIVEDEDLDLEKINKYDFVIFASKHESEKGGKTLSVHAPGNFRDADFGGEPEKVCKTSALIQKMFLKRLTANAEKFHLKDYAVTLECTHHGPLIEKPCVFVEIGATETEWKDRKAGFAVAKAISEVIDGFKVNERNEIAIGLGGPHYCPSFNKIQLNSNFAVGHVIPQYIMPITEEMIQQAFEKTDEEVDLAIVDWKGLGTSEQRQQVIDILDKMHLRYERTNRI